VRKHRAPSAISADELLWRYAYVLGNVPTSTADRAYAAAFDRLPAPQRERVTAELAGLVSLPERVPLAADPGAFAVFMRNLAARDALIRAPSAGVLAAAFITSAPVIDYFTTGIGSVSIDQHPPWIHELAGHETAPIDAGAPSRREGTRFAAW
jgi:hypothetical protein